MPGSQSWLDGLTPRLVAVALCLGALAFLAYLHREDLLPDEQTQAEGNSAFAACTAQRYGEIDKMRQDDLINDTQVDQFKARAEAMCWDQTKQDGQ